jgi:cell division protein FtsL
MIKKKEVTDMAESKKRKIDAPVYGNLAYDIDALAREKRLEDAGLIREEERHPQPQPVPRAQSVARPRLRVSPMLVLGSVVLCAMVVVLLMGYAKLTDISDNVVTMQEQLSTLEDEHVALLTKYEKAFDLATIKTTAEAAGMKKPGSGQIYYIDLSSADNAVVYQANSDSLLNRVFAAVGGGISSVVEYFK